MADQAQESSDRDSVLDTIKGSRDALSVKRVFGDSYEVDGLTLIPVARVSGGAGGGWSEGGPGDEDGEGGGSGSGSGFGLRVSPIGVYQVRDGVVEWKPSVDVNRVARGGQILAGVLAVCIAAVLWRRR